MTQVPRSHKTLQSEELYAKATFAIGIVFLGFELAYFLSLQSFSFVHPSIDAFGFPVGHDFINSWMGGRSAFAGGPGPWFDAETYNAALRQITGRPDIPVHYWSYPPHIVLLLWPLGLLPYLPAYVLWCGLGLALYVFAARCGGARQNRILFLAIAPGVAVNMFFGQNGFLTAALMIGGLANLDRRPVLSGILLGLLTIKPQFGLLVPVLLATTGRWRIIAAAAATAVALAGVTSLWFGADIWGDFVQKVMPQQRGLIADAGDFGWPMVSSAFVNARLIGLPRDLAWVLQAVFSAFAVVAVVWTFRRRRDPVLSQAFFVVATFLFSPWMLNYDMVVFGWIVALLRERQDNTKIDHALALVVWTLPLTMMALGAVNIPAAMFVLPAFAARLLWRLARGETHETAGGTLALAPAA
jgi:hypothetical protein